MVSPNGYSLEVTDFDAATSALKTTNSDADGLALEAVGKTKLNGDVEISDEQALTIVDGDRDGNALYTKNSNEGNDARALKAEGKVEIKNGILMLDNCPIQTLGAQSLYIGSGQSNFVYISRQNFPTHIRGNLRVYQVTELDARLDAQGHIRVGDANNDGLIDAADDSRDLKIGTQADFTGDIILSRDGKITDIMGKGRLNENELILDSSPGLSLAEAGYGIVYNAAGHAPQNTPSLDFVIQGTVVGYIDSTGWH